MTRLSRLTQGVGLSSVALCGACSLVSQGSGFAGARDEDPQTADLGEEVSEGESTDDAATRAPADAATSPDIVDAGAELGDDLIGYYAERRAFRTIQAIQTAAVNEDVRVLTTSYALARIDRAHGALTLTERACRIVTENQGGRVPVEVLIDDRVPRSIPDASSELIVRDDGDTLRWARPLLSAPLGWTASATTDSLPSDQNDPRVRDQDSDGKPGVTARVRADLGLFGSVDDDVYIVQWNRARYEGAREPDGRLRGENIDSSAMRIIGATNPLLRMNPETRPDPDTSDNHVVLVPLAAPLSCDQLVGQLDTLFR